MSRKAVGVEWLKYSLRVVARYKFPPPAGRAGEPGASAAASSPAPAADAGAPVTHGHLDDAWTHVDDVACGCPKLTLRKTYLFAGRILSLIHI